MNYLKIAIVILLITVTIGCSNTKYVPQIQTNTIYKPVYTPPENIVNLQPISRPDLRSNHLTKQDSEKPGFVIKVLIETIGQLRTYAEKLENNIDVYKSALLPQSTPKPKP